MGIRWSQPRANENNDTGSVNNSNYTSSTSSDVFISSIQATRAAISRPIFPIPIWSPQMHSIQLGHSNSSGLRERFQTRRRNRSPSISSEHAEIPDADGRERQRLRTSSYTSDSSHVLFNIFTSQESDASNTSLPMPSQLLDAMDNDSLIRIVVVEQRPDSNGNDTEILPVRIMILFRNIQSDTFNARSNTENGQQTLSSATIDLVQWIMLLLLHRSIPVLRSTLDEMSYEDLLVLQEMIGIVPRYTRQELVDQQLGIHKFSVQENSYKLSCPICLDSFKDNEPLRKLPCCHMYHLECIDPWLTKHCNNCPLCRSVPIVQ